MLFPFPSWKALQTPATGPNCTLKRAALPRITSEIGVPYRFFSKPTPAPVIHAKDGVPFPTERRAPSSCTLRPDKCKNSPPSAPPHERDLVAFLEFWFRSFFQSVLFLFFLNFPLFASRVKKENNGENSPAVGTSALDDPAQPAHALAPG